MGGNSSTSSSFKLEGEPLSSVSTKNQLNSASHGHTDNLGYFQTYRPQCNDNQVIHESSASTCTNQKITKHRASSEAAGAGHSWPKRSMTPITTTEQHLYHEQTTHQNLEHYLISHLTPEWESRCLVVFLA